MPGSGVKPNILFLMCDQLQKKALESPLSRTPHLDRLASRGVAMDRAYTPNPVCSPARASILTGKLPHNHNVMWVTHTMHRDQVRMKHGVRHAAEDLVRAGYETCYVGKWHAEPTERPADFGWTRDLSLGSEAMRATQTAAPDSVSHGVEIGGIGYDSGLLAGVSSLPPSDRPLGRIVDAARAQLNDLHSGCCPWCLFVSVPEPHDPFVCSKEALDAVPDGQLLAATWDDSLDGRPSVYQMAATAFASLTPYQRLHVSRCYHGSVSEIDTQFGLLLEDLTALHIDDSTIVVLLTDHGEFLGAHGMYGKNVGAWEEAYNVPLIVAGPGVPSRGARSRARVGTHGIFPSILNLAGVPCSIRGDAPSFHDVLSATDQDAIDECGSAHRTGLAEYHGGRYFLSQRVYYEDDWKLVWNGFDMPEFYDLAADPTECTNLSALRGPAHEERNGIGREYRRVVSNMWRELERVGDATLVQSHYFGARISQIGPSYRSS